MRIVKCYLTKTGGDAKEGFKVGPIRNGSRLEFLRDFRSRNEFLRDFGGSQTGGWIPIEINRLESPKPHQIVWKGLENLEWHVLDSGTYLLFIMKWMR